MKMFLISDNIDTTTGLRLAGVEGVVVKGREETLGALEKAMADNDIGIVLITELLADLIPDVISDIKLNRSRPLIVEIPDRHGTRRPPDYIIKRVNDAVGIKLE
ncbi:MAG TPA: ATP synthase subunit F [Clostridiaceae bacterium]|jgi:V/A-type H+-transporting ATPase subunit F|nr:ATP synthase subunit F [Clostridiaceae bacterium]